MLTRAVEDMENLTELTEAWNKEHMNYVMLFMPSYFLNDSVSPSDISAVKNSWSLLLHNQCAAFVDVGEQRQRLSDTMQWFTQIYFDRLYCIIPNWIQTFGEDYVLQKKFLISLVGNVVTLQEDPKKLRKYLVDLALKYNRVGVRPLDYGVIGDVLLWSLDRVLKKEMEEDPSLRKAWCKLYSQCLRTLIPVSLILNLK